MSTAYELGYRDGRQAGYQKGVEDGKAAGIRDSVMPLALIVTPAVELPSLEIILLQPFRVLKQLGIYNFKIRTEHEVTVGDMNSAAIVIVLRSVEPRSIEVLRAANHAGKPTVYVIDDNFLEIPPGTPVSDYYRDPMRRQIFEALLREASLVKVDSRFFADYIRLYFNPRVTSFPSSVDFDLIDPVPKPSAPRPYVVIGYEGTQKDEDFAPVTPALIRVLQKYGKAVRLQFYGYAPQELLKFQQVSYSTGQIDYRTFMRILKGSEWDIGLAPLKDSMFNYCKTNNKFREYAACLIPGIYSISPPYVEHIVHGQTGYLVENTEEAWFQGLCAMIDNAVLRETIRIQAWGVSRQMFHVDACVANWREHVLHV
mgnify:CR=1 FL=1